MAGSMNSWTGAGAPAQSAWGSRSQLFRSAQRISRSDASVTWEIPGSASDLSGFSSLQFRAAQGTRHPDTTAVFGDQDFEVVLIDGDGDEQAISIGAYGGGIEEPYQRTGFGTGAGWQNEYEVIRIRLAEFTVDGSSVDLDDIAAIRLDFGPSSGTSRGRISVDDLIVLP